MQLKKIKYRTKLWDEIKYLGSQGLIAYLNYRLVVNKSMRSINKMSNKNHVLYDELLVAYVSKIFSKWPQIQHMNLCISIPF